MTVRVAINGFGRMGRLGLRAAWGCEELEFVHINEIAGDATCSAHLLKYDSVHGIWGPETGTDDQGNITIDDKTIGYSMGKTPAEIDWKSMNIDLMIDGTGKFKTTEKVQPYFDQGIKKVVVSAPVKTEPALNMVYGVTDHLYEPDKHHLVTPASCTTNCIAPVIKVLKEKIGIKTCSYTTIHDITNTQTIIDKGHKDLRRARACGMSLIPTTSGSAKAIVQIYPDLAGKIDGMAVRVPLLNGSLTDMVVEVERETTIDEINGMMKEAAEGELKGILGYEEKPLVSIDYNNDIRSGIVDAPLTMVTNKTQVKLMVWYDNEVGYAHRMMDLVRKVARSM